LHSAFDLPRWRASSKERLSRTGMTDEEFAAAYPPIMSWIRKTLANYRDSAESVASVGFLRLPLYFGTELLETTKVVRLDRVPVPPLSAFGLQRFNEFERGDYDGITYLDTIFIKRSRAADEELHFHELIHVVQWRLIGPERFLALYADGLDTFGYHNSPLEKMAYSAQNDFAQGSRIFRAETLVTQQLRELSAL
jgi:hypothetical protein